jgi:hypothetical protein
MEQSLPCKFKKDGSQNLSCDILVKEMEEEKQDNSEKHRELLKEVLRRANKKERQEYDEISDRQDAIIDRIQEIYSEQKQLSERSSKNEYPKTIDTEYTLKSAEELMRMTIEETRWGYFAQYRRYKSYPRTSLITINFSQCTK